MLFSCMAQHSDLAATIARNIRYFMSQDKALYKNANAIAVKSKISANTVRNILNPTKRTTTSEKPNGYPTLDKLEAIANTLGCQTWQLLHPDIARAIRAVEMYSSIEQNFTKLEGTKSKNLVEV